MARLSHGTLPLALSAALSGRRASVLRHLLQSHGPVSFADAVACLTGRHMADVLSLLSVCERAEVYRHLTAAASARLAQTGMANPYDSPLQSLKQHRQRARSVLMAGSNGSTRSSWCAAPTGAGIAA